METSIAVTSAPALDETVLRTVPRALPAVVPELDGVRGMAILLVLCWHSSGWLTPVAPLRFLQYGHIGVDLFFVLSGFLITGILLDTRNDPNRVRNFYVRRGLRIWPLYFVYLAVAWLLFRWMVPPSPHLWAFALFIQNFLNLDGTGPFLQPTWSLAVEEQFYAAWPWLAFRCRPQAFAKVCVGIVICSPLVRLAFYTMGSSEWFVYANTLTRLDAIAAGAALAVWIRHPRFDRENMQQFGLGTAVLGGMAAVITLRFAESSAGVRNASYSFVALACAGVVAMTLGWQGENILLPRLFRQRWLRFLGKISFALYLFNYPIYVLVHGNRGTALTSRLRLSGLAAELLLFLLGNAVLVAAAWLSWQLLEKPMLQLKSRLAAR